jgi:hypothetical protein
MPLTLCLLGLGHPTAGLDVLMKKIEFHGKRRIMDHSWILFPRDHGGTQDPDSMVSSQYWRMFQYLVRLTVDSIFFSNIVSGLALANNDDTPFRMKAFWSSGVDRWKRVWILLHPHSEDA